MPISAFRIAVHHQDFLALPGEGDAQVDRRSGLTRSALLIGEGENRGSQKNHLR